jgi:hypothetical protein
VTILDDLRPPPKPRNEKLEQLITVTCQRVSMLDLAELARAGAHEYDEDAIVPGAGSAGKRFLRAAANTFTRWLNREGRFPAGDEIAEVAGQVQWHRGEVRGSLVAQAYVDLGLFYSYHANVARGAALDDLQRVLDAVADQMIFTLSEDYGPLV